MHERPALQRMRQALTRPLQTRRRDRRSPVQRRDVSRWSREGQVPRRYDGVACGSFGTVAIRVSEQWRPGTCRDGTAAIQPIRLWMECSRPMIAPDLHRFELLARIHPLWQIPLPDGARGAHRDPSHAAAGAARLRPQWRRRQTAHNARSRCSAPLARRSFHRRGATSGCVITCEAPIRGRTKCRGVLLPSTVAEPRTASLGDRSLV